jgi:hypothetical protein
MALTHLREGPLNGVPQRSASRSFSNATAARLGRVVVTVVPVTTTLTGVDTGRR